MLNSYKKLNQHLYEAMKNIQNIYIHFIHIDLKIK